MQVNIIQTEQLVFVVCVATMKEMERSGRVHGNGRREATKGINDVNTF